MSDETVGTVLAPGHVARITHEANRLYCELLGDFSQVPWDEAPEWQRDSALEGVRAVFNGTAKSPEAQHEAWMQYKLAGGWTYGAEKDPAAKKHPCLVPYAELPAEQRRKDHLFRAIVTALTEPV
jgi:RyR domain